METVLRDQPLEMSCYNCYALDEYCFLPVCPSVRLFVCYKTGECNILKMNEPMLLQIGVIGPRGKEMKRSAVGIRASKVKVTD